MTRTPDSVTYLLRDVDGGVWSRFKARAADADLAMRDVLLDLVRAYAEGSVRIDRRAVKTKESR